MADLRIRSITRCLSKATLPREVWQCMPLVGFRLRRTEIHRCVRPVRAETREPGLNSNFLPMINASAISSVFPVFRRGEESGLRVTLRSLCTTITRELRQSSPRMIANTFRPPQASRRYSAWTGRIFLIPPSERTRPISPTIANPRPQQRSRGDRTHPRPRQRGRSRPAWRHPGRS
jgi:hypothetical protein